MPESRPFAVYVSIPFCRVQCHSCHCFKGLLPKARDRDEVVERYVEAVIAQAHAYGRRQRFQSAPCATVYIGGGTASVLTIKQSQRLIRGLRAAFRMEPDTELNFEGNPGDFTRNFLQCLKDEGVTRISIGYQSKRQHILNALNSPHSAKEAVDAVEAALCLGFDTVNVDLLYNVPGQSLEDWTQEVRDLIAFGPQGIGAGDYVVFPGSASERLISRGRLAPQHDLETTFRWYQIASEILAENGYDEQVRGLFAKAGHAQRYVDLCCPKGSDIVGLGAGAFGFVGRHQFQNLIDVVAFSQRVVEEGRMFEVSSVSRRASDDDLMSRFVMHNFFAFKLNRQAFFTRFGRDPVETFGELFRKLEAFEMVNIDETEIRLTEIGRKWRRNIYHEFRAPQDRPS